MQLVAELAIVTGGFNGQEATSDGRRPGRGESVARGQHDERGVVEVRVEPCSSKKNEELQHQEKGGNRQSSGTMGSKYKVRVPN